MKDGQFTFDITLGEISKEYKPGLLSWIKKDRPMEWAMMLTLEEKINPPALKGNIENLKDALSNYKKFILGMVKVFETPKGHTQNLF